MKITEIFLGILAVLGLAGVIILLCFDKSINVILPILTAIVSYLLGKKQGVIIARFKKSK